jgi:hypothetical protein
LTPFQLVTEIDPKKIIFCELVIPSFETAKHGAAILFLLSTKTDFKKRAWASIQKAQELNRPGQRGSTP